MQNSHSPFRAIATGASFAASFTEAVAYADAVIKNGWTNHNCADSVSRFQRRISLSAISAAASSSAPSA
jgi:hypothetical protein